MKRLLLALAVMILGSAMVVIPVIHLLKFSRGNLYAMLGIFPMALGIGALVTGVKLLRGENPRTWFP